LLIVSLVSGKKGNDI